MSDELKPCPFCGGEAKTIETKQGWHMNIEHEPTCFHKTEVDDEWTKAKAIEAWNTRAERTCRNLSKDFAVLHCSACGYFERDCACANYCPKYGAEVVGK